MKLINFSLIFFCILPGWTTCLAENKGKLQNYQGNATITDETLRQLLEKFRQMLHNPEVLPDQQFYMNKTDIILNASLTNASVTDLTSFNINTEHVDMQKLEFTIKLSYSSLAVNGKYGLYLDNAYVKMESSDNFSVIISEASSSVFIKLNLTQNQTLQVESFSLDYDMKVKVDFKFLGGNAEVSVALNNLMNQLMPEMILVTKPDIQLMANAMVLEKSKFLLGGMTLQQFIDLINNFVGS